MGELAVGPGQAGPPAFLPPRTYAALLNDGRTGGVDLGV